MADPALDSLRQRIDQLDRALLDVVAERLEVCRAVADVKGHEGTPVIQPTRVRDVLTTRRQQAIEAGIDPDFAEQLFRVLLAETHRIEVAGSRPDPAPEKAASTGESRSALDTSATRVDHVVIAVHDVAAARASLVERFGFRDAPLVGAGGGTDFVAVVAGGVMLVLVGPGASPAVAKYLARHGDGVQHVAIEVLNAGYAHAALAASGAPLVTDVVVDADGHEQFFAGADPTTGLQLGFISRVGHRVGVGTANVLALFDALGDDDVHAPRRRHRRAGFATLLAVSVLLGACTSEPSTIGTAPRTVPGDSTDTTTPVDLSVQAGQPFPAARCAANKAAGTITFLTGFDFAAAASMVDVFVARSRGYYAALCLDVAIEPSFSADNYAKVAADSAQFASGGSFGELVDYAGRNEAQFKALAVEGRQDIATLIVKPDEVATLDAVRGKTIGVKGAMLPSVEAMLLDHGLRRGTDYDVVELDGFDPKVHIATPDVAGFDGYQSNEPLQLSAADIDFRQFNPSDEGIPGSFGVIYSNATFLDAHPTAAEDFMRATMRGLRDALNDPAAAAEEAVKLLDASDNPQSLSAEGETARWGFESRLVADSATAAFPLGVPDPVLLEKEIAAYGSLGVFHGITPDYSQAVDTSMVKSLYDSSGTIVWPASTG